MTKLARSLRTAALTSVMATLALYGCGGSSDSEASGGAGGTGATSGAGGTGGGSGGAAGAGNSGGAAGAGNTGGGGVGGAPTAQECLKDVYDGLVYVDYDQFNPVVGSHCNGTNHQDIQGVEQLVFLGDSITVGTFPTPQDQVYRKLLTDKVLAKFPGIPVKSCAVNGARADDYFSGDNQIPKCFPAAESKKTLIVMTMGGNDIADMATKKKSVSEAQTQAAQVLVDMRKAVEWLVDPINFPNGSYVVWANIYEYTDLTANLSSCPTGALAGFSGEWIPGTAILTMLREGYMKIAVDTKTDLLFMGEHFCGHGYNANLASGQCYRGPNTANWFDISCIHPTPEGHTQIADTFMTLIDE